LYRRGWNRSGAQGVWGAKTRCAPEKWAICRQDANFGTPHAFSKETAVLRIAPDRGKQHLHGLIGDGFAGIVGSDRFSAYNSLDPEQRQVCWSHLRRDFTFHADLGLGAQETFGLDGLEVTWNVFHAWKQFQRDGDREALQQRVAVIKQQMRPLLEWGSTGKRQRHVRALAKNLLKLWPALWTFADVPDVEPTNNAAERGLRAAVIYRKLSLGSRSQGGERTIERLLSVDQTCRLQRRSLYGYISDVLAARTRGDPIPTLA
jgi:transposase